MTGISLGKFYIRHLKAKYMFKISWVFWLLIFFQYLSKKIEFNEMIGEENYFIKKKISAYQQKMRLTQRQFYISLLFLITFIISILIITNRMIEFLWILWFFCFIFSFFFQVNLSIYENEEESDKLKIRLDALYSYFNKFTNISFPISYSLQFYENYSEMPIIYIITPTDNKRITQLADLTRMRNTLWLLPKIVW